MIYSRNLQKTKKGQPHLKCIPLIVIRTNTSPIAFMCQSGVHWLSKQGFFSSVVGKI